MIDALWRRSAPPPPAPADPALKGVFLIVGSSYCGSTLLNILLGAHPRVAGGGELHWLVRADDRQRAHEGLCVFCKEDCRLWTPAVRDAITADMLYETTARVFGKPFVCDASKMPAWSEFMAPLTAARRLRILMVKHPLRHVASFVEKERRRDPSSPLADIDEVLRQLAIFYKDAHAEPIDRLLRYEDLAADPRGVATELLGRFGLAYDTAMDDWRAHPHHHIGGNAGPRSQILPTSRPTGGLLQRKYNRKDIFIDDSFAAILGPEEVERVIANPHAQAMFDAFGYEPRIEAVRGDHDLDMDLGAGERSLRTHPAPLDMPFEPYGGLCFIARMDLMPQHLYIHSVANNESGHRRSTLALFEDGRPLGPPHTPGATIRSEGAGRYNHWKDVLIFTTSDNSDPNTNGHRYSLGVAGD